MFQCRDMSNLEGAISGPEMVPPHHTHTHTHLFFDTSKDLYQTLKHRALLFDPIMELSGQMPPEARCASCGAPHSEPVKVL